MKCTTGYQILGIAQTNESTETYFLFYIIFMSYAMTGVYVTHLDCCLDRCKGIPQHRPRALLSRTSGEELPGGTALDKQHWEPQALNQHTSMPVSAGGRGISVMRGECGRRRSLSKENEDVTSE